MTKDQDPQRLTEISWADVVGKTYDEIRVVVDGPFQVANALAAAPSDGEQMAMGRMYEASNKLASAMTYLSGGGLALIAGLVSASAVQISNSQTKTAITCFVAALLIGLIGQFCNLVLQMRNYQYINKVIGFARTLNAFYVYMERDGLTGLTPQQDQVNFIVNNTNGIVTTFNKALDFAAWLRKWGIKIASLILCLNVLIIVTGAALTLASL